MTAGGGLTLPQWDAIPTFEVLIFGGPGVVIVMLPCPPVPPTISGELALIGVLTGMWQPPSLSPLLPPSRSVLPRAFFVETALRNWTARLPQKKNKKKSIVLSKKMSSPGGVKHPA